MLGIIFANEIKKMQQYWILVTLSIFSQNFSIPVLYSLKQICSTAVTE